MSAPRNFWINAEIDGPKSKIILAGGPAAADGGFDMTVNMADASANVPILRITGKATPMPGYDGLVLTVEALRTTRNCAHCQDRPGFNGLGATCKTCNGTGTVKLDEPRYYPVYQTRTLREKPTPPKANRKAKAKRPCIGRTPGNVLTSYACSKNARPGSDYCYSHDPATESERMARAKAQSQDRQLERQQREEAARRAKAQA